MRALVLALVFVATFALVMTSVALRDRRRLSAARAARARLTPAADALDDARPVRLLRRAERLSSIRVVERALAGREITRRVHAALVAAGIRLRVGHFLLIVTCSAAGGLALGALWVGVLGAVPLAALGAAAPFAAVARARALRRGKLERQLPEAIDTIVNSLRAGYSFPAALEAAGAETPAPLGPEFARVRDEQRLGVDPRAALTALADRVDTADARLLVTAVLIQRETGGNLAELLAGLAGTVRERAAFRGRVASLTAEPRLSALVLSMLPLAMLLLLGVLNPPYVRPMFEVPLGRMLLLLAALASGLGYVVLRRLGDVEL